jgi:hypothetical protein
MMQARFPSIEPEDVFRTPWYCCGTPNSSMDAFGTLSSRNRVKISSVLMKTFGTARKHATTSSPPKLRFSRQSTTTSLLNRELSESKLMMQQEGVFVCLCRILMCKTMTVSSEPTDEDIVHAFRENYDSIFCSTT